MGSMMLPKYKGSANSISVDGEFPPDIAKYGYLRKLKTMKKKYIVLRLDSDAGPARLEYYDNEKKCRNGQAPKRSIVLKNCFNINRKMDSKHKFALALYTRDDCFALVAENEAEMEAWLGALLKLQQGRANWDGEPQPKPNFEHVWQVNVKNRGLASTCSITGPHHLCLTSQTLSLVKMNSDKDNPLQFPLISIRRCGHSDCFFFMELGRSAITGCGELWMATEDNIIAQNMHETILGAMLSSRNSHEDLGPIHRPRSASTSDNNSKGGSSTASRPVAVVNPQLTPGNSVTSMTGSFKDPPFRSRTVSEGHHDLRAMRENMIDPLRPHSTAYSHSVSYSPPMTNKPLSPGSSAYSDSAGSSHSIDDYESDYHPNRIYPYQQEGTLHTEPTITEEPSDDYLPMSPGDFPPLDQMVSEVGSHQEISGFDYMQMSYQGGASYPINRHMGIDSNNRKQMFLSLSSHQPDSCPTSPTTDYIEMASPASSIQDSVGEGYIPMSPVGSLSVDLNISGSTNNSSKRLQGPLLPLEGSGNSHLSGLPSETYSGYVPMAPVRENEGYMDMSSLSSSLPKNTAPVSLVSRSSHMDVNATSCSSHSLQDVSFGSPSASSSVEEYHLDKVKSFFPPSEDDGEVYIKPARAYSIGSRPQVKKSHLAAHLETSRVRAYSFGSQASSRRRETSGFGGIEAELGTLRNIDARNKKSSSAPLLQSGHIQTPTSNTMPPLPNSSNTRGNSRLSGGRTVNNHNEDLMEIVYHQPPYVRMKSEEHSSRRYSMGSHWQRSNNRSGHDSKGNGKEEKRNQAEGCDLIEGSNWTKRSENEYMEMPKSNSKNGNTWDEQVEPYRSLQGSSGKKPLKKIDAIDNSDASRSSHQVSTGSKGSQNLHSGNTAVRKNEEADNLGHKKGSMKSQFTKKPSKQKSECSDYMEMGRGSTASTLQHSSYSLDTSSSNHGDYVNLDMSCRQLESTQPKPISSIETAPPLVSNMDTLPHDYMNLQPGSFASAEETDKVAIEAETKQVSCNIPVKANSTNASLDYEPSQQQPLKPLSTLTGLSENLSVTRKSSCPILTANNSENKGNIRRASHSPERISVSEVDIAGSRRSLVEGPYENIQVGTPRQLSVERQLNYASLDLAPTSSSEDIVPRSPRILKVPGMEDEVPLSYAEIDFTKSEGLRNTSGSLREGRV